MFLLSGFVRIDHDRPLYFTRMGGQFRLIRNLFLDAAGLDVYAEKQLNTAMRLRFDGGFWAYGYGDTDVTWRLRPRLETGLTWNNTRRWFVTTSAGIEADPDSPSLYGFLEVQRSF